jgi:hypothetical protein
MEIGGIEEPSTGKYKIDYKVIIDVTCPGYDCSGPASAIQNLSVQVLQQVNDTVILLENLVEAITATVATGDTQLIYNSEHPLFPTQTPSTAPSISLSPSNMPNSQPSIVPSKLPSNSPSLNPSDVPSRQPSTVPSIKPSQLTN